MVGKTKTLRNFWFNIDIDGRESQVSGGPIRADGGMRGTLRTRHKGRILDAFRIQARALEDGSLVLEVYPASTGAEALVEHHKDKGVGHVLRITTER